jgi:hypothetical protein
VSKQTTISINKIDFERFIKLKIKMSEIAGKEFSHAEFFSMLINGVEK